jgi:hypothetical protein
MQMTYNTGRNIQKWREDRMKVYSQLVSIGLKIEFNITSLSTTMNNTYRVYTKESYSFKFNKKFISRLTRAQRIPSTAATVQVSHALPAVRFSWENDILTLSLVLGSQSIRIGKMKLKIYV